MKELKNWKPGERIHVLPYGLGKIGKTFGAGSFPRPCWMSFDPDGISTLVGDDFIKQYGFRNLPYEDFYEKFFQGPVVKQHFAYDAACKFFDEMMSAANHDRFETWVVDSGTTLSEVAQNKAIILLGTTEYHKLSGTHEQALKHGMVVPKIQDYGAERSLVEQFVDMVLSSDKHVVFICHEKEIRDKQGNLVGIAPLLTGQSAEAVPLRFSEVYNIQRKAEPETLNGKPTGRVAFRPVCRTVPDGLRKMGSRNGVADGTPWNFPAIEGELKRIHEARVRAMTSAADKAAAAAVSPKAP